MSDGTIAPRPGVECNQVVTLTLGDSVPLDMRGEGQLEGALNDEFVEPNMGELSITFRSRVSQADPFSNKVTIMTTSSRLTSDHIMTMINIVERQLQTNVTGWEMSTRMERKKSVVDFI